MTGVMRRVTLGLKLQRKCCRGRGGGEAGGGKQRKVQGVAIQGNSNVWKEQF